MERIVSARVEQQRWFVRFPRAVPLGVFLAAMAVTLLGVFAIEHTNRERRRAQLSETANAVGAALEWRASAQRVYLRAGALLLAEGGEVTDARFHELAEELRDVGTFHGSDGLTWSARVAAKDIPAFEAVRREDDTPSYTVHPALAAGRDFALPVTYSTNLGSRRAAAGYDLYSEPVRRKAIDTALRERHPVATGAIFSQATRHWSLAIFMPVVRKAGGAPVLAGVLGVPINLQAYLSGLPEADLGIGNAMRLYDDNSTTGQLLARAGWEGTARETFERPVMIAGHRLVLQVSSSAASWSGLAIATLLFGLLVAALLALLARLVTRQAAEDRAAVDWLREQASIRTSLTRELNHRVKNTLANVLSIVALTKRRTNDLESFANGLEGRIRALSATHDLLTRIDWGQAPLREIIEAELALYTVGRDHAVELSGPDVALAPNDALSLGLAIHELVTNATKFGALSTLSGRLTIDWAMEGEDLVRIRWRERGGPPVPEERRRGFGTDLIERIVAHELGRAGTLDFAPEGVSCELAVPVRVPAAFRMRAAKAGG